MNEDDPRFQKSRSAIVEAAIGVLSLNPSAGMTDIASAAGVGRATLYRHYESREALIRDIALACLSDSDERLAPVNAAGLTGLEAITATIDALLPMGNRYRFLMSTMSDTAMDGQVSDLYNRQMKDLASLIEQAKAAGEIRDDIPTAWIAASIDAQLYAAWELSGSQLMSGEAVATAMKESLVSGIRAR